MNKRYLGSRVRSHLNGNAYACVVRKSKILVKTIPKTMDLMNGPHSWQQLIETSEVAKRNAINGPIQF